MASLTIRNLEDNVKARLRVQAAQHRRSMEEEARQILRQAVGAAPASISLADLAATLFGDQGAELEPHPAVDVRRRPACRS